MKETFRTHWLFLLLWIPISLFSFRGVEKIPFHPDESTYIFMSQDFDPWLTRPASLGWDAAKLDDPAQRYRAIDPPLGKYLIGLGRTLAGLQSTSTDWDWTASWTENQEAGALPDERLLLSARLAVTALIPLSMLLTYLTGIHIEGRMTGLIGAVLLGLNGLTQLHARRAMNEGPLLFGLLFLLWAVTHPRPRGWLIGLGMALAVYAKHSAGTLVPAGCWAAGWIPSSEIPSARQRLFNLGQAGVVFIFLTVAFNPILTRNPLQAIDWGFQERITFLERQTKEFEARDPTLRQQNISGRLIATFAQVYLLPPSFSEAGNYAGETMPAEIAYLQNPGVQLLRGPIWGTVFLILTLFGTIVGVLKTRAPRQGQGRAVILTLTATGLTLIPVLWLVDLPFQRYYLPLVPFASLWSGFGLASLYAGIRKRPG